MARTPRASVSKTSGQGVSRLSYQKGRKLAGDARVKGDFIVGPGSVSKEREYSKGGKKAEYPKGINVSYGDTYEPTDLKDIQERAKKRK